MALITWLGLSYSYGCRSAIRDRTESSCFMRYRALLVSSAGIRPRAAVLLRRKCLAESSTWDCSPYLGNRIRPPGVAAVAAARPPQTSHFCGNRLISTKAAIRCLAARAPRCNPVHACLPKELFQMPHQARQNMPVGSGSSCLK